ncbi:polymorphic toxin-type HINT domain-containing protein, partial [Actinoplanes sichuanensis]
SAADAKAAAAAADRSADAAAGSAASAAASAQTAASSAAAAAWDATNAVASAVQAGLDAGKAAQAGLEAAKAEAALRMKELMESRGSDEYQRLRCLGPNISSYCRMVRAQALDAIKNPLRCGFNPHSEGCKLLGEVGQKLEETYQAAVIVLQIGLALCGLVPAVGEACDLLDGAISAAQGDWVGAGLSATSLIPGLGMASGGVKLVDKLRELKRLFDKVGAACGGGNSFTPDTLVLLGDGGTKPIREIRVGDEVLASDPVRGVTEPKPVTALITGSGDKDLVDVSIGDGTVTATAAHRFWSAERRDWVAASRLGSGQWLRDGSGRWVQVASAEPRRRAATVHNLTVADLHTYYVLAGRTPVLVHNDGAGLCDDAIKAALGGIDRLNHAWRHLQEAGIVTGNWSQATSPDKLRAILGPILKNPVKRFVPTHTQGDAVEIMVGQHNGRWIAVQVWTAGNRKGEMATAYEPTPDQLRNWGVIP